jgi:hypothetical protein
MDNKIENKLVIISGPGSGQELYLLQGRTTIGSAPGNDVRLDGQEISGFHAEFRTENNAFSITDFSSEGGTFVNDERIDKNKKVAAGDIIQIGALRTVFLPRNAVISRENICSENFQNAPMKGAPTYKKWCILACIFLVMISAIKVAFGTGKNLHWHREEPKAPDDHIVRGAHSGKDESGVSGEQKDSTAKSARENEIGSLYKPLNDETGTSTESSQNLPGKSPQDEIAHIHLNIAKRFVDYQLWYNALEHYRSVFERIPEYPELSVQIARMQSEINNQTAYQQGQALIQNGGYEEGIASMKHIDENSFYYNEALKTIADAKEKMAQTKKAKQ